MARLQSKELLPTLLFLVLAANDTTPVVSPWLVPEGFDLLAHTPVIKQSMYREGPAGQEWWLAEQAQESALWLGPYYLAYQARQGETVGSPQAVVAENEATLVNFRMKQESPEGDSLTIVVCRTDDLLRGWARTVEPVFLAQPGEVISRQQMVAMEGDLVGVVAHQVTADAIRVLFKQIHLPESGGVDFSETQIISFEEEHGQFPQMIRWGDSLAVVYTVAEEQADGRVFVGLRLQQFDFEEQQWKGADIVAPQPSYLTLSARLAVVGKSLLVFFEQTQAGSPESFNFAKIAGGQEERGRELILPARGQLQTINDETTDIWVAAVTQEGGNLQVRPPTLVLAANRNEWAGMVAPVVDRQTGKMELFVVRNIGLMRGYRLQQGRFNDSTYQLEELTDLGVQVSYPVAHSVGAGRKIIVGQAPYFVGPTSFFFLVAGNGQLMASTSGPDGLGSPVAIELPGQRETVVLMGDEVSYNSITVAGLNFPPPEIRRLPLVRKGF